MDRARIQQTREAEVAARATDPTYMAAQLAGLRKRDPAAWSRYNYDDPREHAVMEEMLRAPWPRTK